MNYGINILIRKTMYYDIKLSVEKEVPSKNMGTTLKVVTEQYICDTDNVGSAFYKVMELYNNECEVLSVSASKIQEIVNDKVEDKPFFKAKLSDVYTNDEGEEKESQFVVLVCAKDITEAHSLMQEYIKQGYDMQMIGINKTKILDII